MGLAIRKDIILNLGMGLYQSEANNEVGDATSKEERKCMVVEASGEGENQQLS